MKELLRSTPVAVAATLAGVLLILVMLELFVLSRPGKDAVPAREKTPAEWREQLRREDEEKLGTYGWVDREKGVVRIPVERAIEKLLEERGAGRGGG